MADENATGPIRRVALTLGLAALMGLLMTTPVLAAPGDLDSSFGNSGTVRTHIGAADSADRTEAMVIDSLGRIVVVGTTSTPVGDAELVIARYLSDGSLDPSFGSGGVAKSDVGFPHDAAIDGSGRIVVVGQVDTAGSDTDVLVARFLSTGAPDPSFGGGDGVITTDFIGFFDSAKAVAVDASGRIVIGGGAPQVLVARYLENGNLDPSFGGGDGFFTETMNDPTTGFLFMGLEDIALDAAGRIVGVGGGFVAMRFSASGVLDTSFGDQGMTGHRVENGDTASAVTIDSIDRILVAGSTGSTFSETVSAFDVGVVRYSESGGLDTVFGDGESMAVAPDAGGYESALDIAVDANGRIVTGGATYDGSTTDFFVVRFLPSGRISGSFGGGDGSVRTDLGGDEFGTAVAFDSGGRIVLAGDAEGEIAFSDDFALLRYEGGPTVDVFHDLTVQISGEGMVTGPGIDCGAECTATYDEGTIVTLTAIPAHDELGEAESVFTGWAGACSGEAETCQVAMGEAKDVTVSFEPTPGGEEEPPVEEEPPTEELPPVPTPTASPPPPVLAVTPPAPTSSPKAKLRKCRKGFVKRKVRGKARCVKRKGKGRR